MLPDISSYEPALLSCWQGRKDSLPKERFFQHVSVEDIRHFSLPEIPNQTVILGFASDEGIRRNEGRTGAKEGPNVIRSHLARLACHTQSEFIDLGNIVCQDTNLEEAQQQLAKLIHYCHRSHYKTLVLGGGHEIAWGHFSGLAPHYPKLGIINFDAHFDLRPLTNNAGTSGTPFAQIQAHCQQNHTDFSYCCLGIQPHSNTKSLFDKANDWSVSYLTAEEIHEITLARQKDFLDNFLQQHNAIYLSICMDVFAEAYAPGVSAPQASGLTPQQVFPLLKYIMQTGKVVSLDIAELSPPLDTNQQTARLAAVLIAELWNLTNARNITNDQIHPV